MLRRHDDIDVYAMNHEVKPSLLVLQVTKKGRPGNATNTLSYIK